jgi:hypothetical protein
MQTPKFKTYFLLEDGVRPEHGPDNFNEIMNKYWNRVDLDGNLWTWYTKVMNSAVLEFGEHGGCTFTQAYA